MTVFKKRSIDKLNEELSLPATGGEQDWDVELADPTRIGEFLTFYQRTDLTPDDQAALMSLILASVDRHLESESRPPALWKEIAALLSQNRELHGETIEYWLRIGEEDPDSWFQITPLLRTAMQD